MEIPSFYNLVFINIFTHIIRSIYEILKHKKLLKANNTTFIIIFLNMLLLWSSWYFLCSSDPNLIVLPAIINYSGIILFLTGIILFLTALFTIRSLETYAGDLITTGIYSKIRHPMYSAFILWLFGLPIYFGGTFSFILAFPLMANVLFWRHLEEIELLARFSDYKVYKQRTLF